MQTVHKKKTLLSCAAWSSQVPGLFWTSVTSHSYCFLASLEVVSTTKVCESFLTSHHHLPFAMELVPFEDDDIPADDQLETPTASTFSHILTGDAKQFVLPSHEWFFCRVGYQVGQVAFWDLMYIFDKLKVAGVENTGKSTKFIQEWKTLATSKEYLGRASIHLPPPPNQRQGWFVGIKLQWL